VSGPVSRALKGSHLAASIRPGTQALPSDKRRHVGEALRPAFADSLDLDEATRVQYPNDARWDYLLGHDDASCVVALETHSAHTSEVGLVIQKRAASRRHLRDHLVAGHDVAAWFWAASGRVDFVPHEKMINRLNENGIEFVGGRLEAKHLTAILRPSRTTSRPRRQPQRTRK
jgi:hypothetical protein